MHPDTGNAELLRLHYLQAMGISSYYPRLRLPGALPSQPCPWPQPASVAEAATTRQASSAVAAPQAGPRDSDKPQPAPVRREPPVAPAQHAAATAGTGQHRNGQETLLQFQLLLLPVDADLAVLCQIPSLAKPQLQDRQSRLLHNLLRWLGKSLNGTSQPRRFQWPLPGLQVPADRGQAAASLGHFVEQALIEQKFRHLVLLGGQLAAQLEGMACVPDGCHLTVTPGLDEMLALPMLKRDAWQALLPLHAELHARHG